MTHEGKRNKSRVEFDNTYNAIDEDIERLISNNFGLSEAELENNRRYLNRKSTQLETLSQNLFLHLKMANAIFPNNKAQLSERQMHQRYASGCCYGILSTYEQIFRHLSISQEKHVEEIKHLHKELNSIKARRDSDKQRFKDL